MPLLVILNTVPQPPMLHCPRQCRSRISAVCVVEAFHCCESLRLRRSGCNDHWQQHGHENHRGTCYSPAYSQNPAPMLHWPIHRSARFLLNLSIIFFRQRLACYPCQGGGECGECDQHSSEELLRLCGIPHGDLLLKSTRIGHERFADCAGYGKGLLSQNCLFGGDSVELCREDSARFQKQLSMEKYPLSAGSVSTLGPSVAKSPFHSSTKG